MKQNYVAVTLSIGSTQNYEVEFAAAMRPFAKLRWTLVTGTKFYSIH